MLFFIFKQINKLKNTEKQTGKHKLSFFELVIFYRNVTFWNQQKNQLKLYLICLNKISKHFGMHLINDNKNKNKFVGREEVEFYFFLNIVNSKNLLSTKEDFNKQNSYNLF